jgi:hypothetical protein
MGKISTKIYIIAGILTLLIFIGGVAIGWVLDYNRVSIVQSQIDALQMDFQNLQLENSFAQTVGDNSTCSLYSSKAASLSAQTDQLASELNRFSNINQFQAQTLTSLKERYTLLNLEFWLQLTNLQKACGYNATTFLYFYAGTPNSPCDDCIAQGLVFDLLKRHAPDRVMIFATDTNLDLGIVRSMVQTWNITSVPSIVVDGKYVLRGFTNQTTLQAYLK